ncbi:DNA-binding protein [Amphritea sp. HPY]|uniref:DNA-binding protein n=1 Tax=Amphritea sp. HPY TaxID=3421652 RepID=UPI003D7ECA88
MSIKQSSSQIKKSTYQKVFEVADRLLSEGQRPTQQNIRNQLGSGSLTTINKALNDWWQSLGERLCSQHQRPEIPEPVFDSANALWQQALAYAEHQFSGQRMALEQQHQELKKQLEGRANSSKGDLQRLQDLSDRLLGENERLLLRCTELQQKLSQQEEREIRLQAENRDLSRELKEMNLILEKLGPAQNSDLNQALQTANHKISYIEGEYSRLDKHNHILSEENGSLRQQLFEVERSAIKDKHNLELVISQQDLRYQDLEQQLKLATSGKLKWNGEGFEESSEADALEVRLAAKEQEVDRLLDLLKSFNKDT